MSFRTPKTNAEMIVEPREDIGEEGAAAGEPDAPSTHAQLLAEKRIGFLLLSLGLVLPERSRPEEPRGPGDDGARRWGRVVIAGFIISVVFTRVVGNRIRGQHAGAGDCSKTPTRCPSSSTRPPSTDRTLPRATT